MIIAASETIISARSMTTESAEQTIAALSLIVEDIETIVANGVETPEMPDSAYGNKDLPSTPKGPNSTKAIRALVLQGGVNDFV